MTKHSNNAPEKMKFVYLSKDDRYLCWKSVDKDDEKRMEITQIDKIIKEGAEYYIKGCSIKDIRKCLVIKGSEKTLQLEAAREIDA